MMKKGTGQGIQLKNELIKKLDEIITLEKPAYKSRHHLIEVLAEKELKKITSSISNNISRKSIEH